MPQGEIKWNREAAVAGHRILRLVVAFGIGCSLAIYAFHRVSDPQPARQRAEEVAAVEASREILARYVGESDTLRIVDPLAPNRAIGKVFVYPTASGFEISGYYRRSDSDTWHPFLMELSGSGLVELSVRDKSEGLRERAAADPKLRVDPR